MARLSVKVSLTTEAPSPGPARGPRGDARGASWAAAGAVAEGGPRRPSRYRKGGVIQRTINKRIQEFRILQVSWVSLYGDFSP